MTGLPHRKGYADLAEAKRSKRGSAPGAEYDEHCPCGKVHVTVPKVVEATRLTLPAVRRDTGFPARVKLLVRARAGDGDIQDARCEHCGFFLGATGGEYQHIVARGMGGTRDPLLNTAANAALLCPPSHRLAETRSAEMLALGFWQRQGTDPRLAPMMLWTPGGRVMVWRGVSGEYLPEPPKQVAA